MNFPLPSAAADLLILQGLWTRSEMLCFKTYSEKMISTANFQPFVKKLCKQLWKKILYNSEIILKTLEPGELF